MRLVCDNLNIHTKAALYELLPPRKARKILEMPLWTANAYRALSNAYREQQNHSKRLHCLERVLATYQQLNNLEYGLLIKQTLQEIDNINNEFNSEQVPMAGITEDALPGRRSFWLTITQAFQWVTNNLLPNF